MDNWQNTATILYRAQTASARESEYSVKLEKLVSDRIKFINAYIVQCQQSINQVKDQKGAKIVLVPATGDTEALLQSAPVALNLLQAVAQTEFNIAKLMSATVADAGQRQMWTDIAYSFKRWGLE